MGMLIWKTTELRPESETKDNDCDFVPGSKNKATAALQLHRQIVYDDKGLTSLNFGLIWHCVEPSCYQSHVDAQRLAGYPRLEGYPQH